MRVARKLQNASDLDAEEQQRVRAAIRHLHARVGDWLLVAESLRFARSTVTDMVCGRTPVSASMAFRRMSHDTKYVKLTDEESKVRRDGGPDAPKLMERKYAECHRLQSQSEDETATVILKDADGTVIEVFDDGTSQYDGSDHG